MRCLASDPKCAPTRLRNRLQLSSLQGIALCQLHSPLGGCFFLLMSPSYRKASLTAPHYIQQATENALGRPKLPNVPCHQVVPSLQKFGANHHIQGLTIRKDMATSGWTAWPLERLAFSTRDLPHPGVAISCASQEDKGLWVPLHPLRSGSQKGKKSGKKQWVA